MTLATILEQDTIHTAAQDAQAAIDLYPRLLRLNELYNSANGVKTTVTQEKLDDLPALSGLTKQQLDDGIFPLTGPILTGIQNSLSQLLELAARE